MTKKTNVPVTSATLFAALLASTQIGYAQETPVFDNIDSAEDAVDAVEDAVADDFRRSRDGGRFGTAYQRQGWTGSLAATLNTASGNSDTVDAGVGARFGYAAGVWQHDFVLGYNYSEANDVRDANSIYGSYDASRDINDRLYAYGKLRGDYDEFGAYEQDYFGGVGLGYRIYNSEDLAWRVQAGPGWRRTKDSAGTVEEEGAALASSKFFYRVNDAVFLTNDTDVLYSDTDTLVSNDLGVNVRLSGPLSLRASLRTDYHTDPLAGNKSTDNVTGLSLVYTFR